MSFRVVFSVLLVQVPIFHLFLQVFVLLVGSQIRIPYRRCRFRRCHKLDLVMPKLVWQTFSTKVDSCDMRSRNKCHVNVFIPCDIKLKRRNDHLNSVVPQSEPFQCQNQCDATFIRIVLWFIHMFCRTKLLSAPSTRNSTNSSFFHT